MVQQFEAFKSITLKHGSGASAEIYPYGAHLCSWRCAKGEERIFLSRQAKFEQGAAIRGGVPIIFPQFNEFGAGPRHGFARNVVWVMGGVSPSGDSCTFTLESSDATRKAWPYDFTCEYKVTLGAESLRLQFAVTNTGGTEAAFTAALHSYLRVEDLYLVSVDGLKGLSFWDNDGTEFSQRKNQLDNTLKFNGAIDRVYFDCSQAFQLREKNKTLLVASEGFEDVVIWNPGAEGASCMGDMGDEEFKYMLCIEAARIERPITLAAGETWVGAQTLTLKPESDDAR